MKQLLTSVVREICTLRSVGAGERATAPGHPVAAGDGCPYRDQQLRSLMRDGDMIISGRSCNAKTCLRNS